MQCIVAQGNQACAGYIKPIIYICQYCLPHVRIFLSWCILWHFHDTGKSRINDKQKHVTPTQRWVHNSGMDIWITKISWAFPVLSPEYSGRSGSTLHDDVIKWKHFPRYWPFVRGIHRSLVNSLHKCQWRGALVFSLICAWTNSWANNGDADDLRRHRAHHDVIVMGCRRPGRFCRRRGSSGHTA